MSSESEVGGSDVAEAGSGATAPGEEAVAPAMAREVARHRRWRPMLTEALVALSIFGAMGLIGAVVWWRIVHLPVYVVTAQGPILDELQLSHQVGIDGWYAVIAVVGGLIAGTVLAVRFSRDPVWTVVLLVLGGLLAAWVMRDIGGWLGPADPVGVLAGATEGARAPIQLHVTMPAVYLMWPLAAMITAVGVIWSAASPETVVGTHRATAD